MSWTDDRVATLKKLWTEGLSASQIAKELGGVSRNAVIGKVHRLGLESRQKAGGKDGDGAPEVHEDAPEPTATAQSAEPAVETQPAPQFEAANDSAPAMDGEDDIVVPIPLKLKLTELTERTCKWPIGDPMHDDFHFCGHEADEGRPYCEYHSTLAFQPASERRRVR